MEAVRSALKHEQNSFGVSLRQPQSWSCFIILFSFLRPRPPTQKNLHKRQTNMTSLGFLIFRFIFSEHVFICSLSFRFFFLLQMRKEYNGIENNIWSFAHNHQKPRTSNSSPDPYTDPVKPKQTKSQTNVRRVLIKCE